MRAMLRLTTVLFSLAVFSAPGSRAAAPVDTQGPLTIQSQGSFFVGGTVRHAEDLGGAASGPEVTRSGDITTGQMYVQYQIPVRPAHLPVVMVHGGGLSGQAYDTSPDGQGPARLRPEQLPIGARQPGAPGAAHRGLLL